MLQIFPSANALQPCSAILAPVAFGITYSFVIIQLYHKQVFYVHR